MIKLRTTSAKLHRPALYRKSNAMTLIELLVVITIIMLLAAVMIPTVRYQYRNRALREAERQLIAFIGSAQARAQQLGRPVGIWIDRFSESETLAGANYAVAVYIAEVPRPYTGEIRDELVEMNNTGKLTFRNNATLLNNRLIKPGDRFKIQFNHRGPYYEAIRDTNGDYNLLLPNTNFGRIPTADFSNGVPYKIQREPKKSFLPPLRLPAGAVIDLSVSGMEKNEFWHAVPEPLSTNPVIIMFQPDGRIDQVFYHEVHKVDPNTSPSTYVILPVVKRPIRWVHLLVGRQNQVFPNTLFIEEATETANVMDMENRWVSINHRTGSINSEQVDSIARQTSSSDIALKLTAARMLVRSGTGSGGN